MPTPQELARISPAGSYLAARHAGLQRDAAAAAAYYRAALRRRPRNGELLAQAFLSVLIDGDVEEAVRLAERAGRRSTRTTASRAWRSACAPSSSKQYQPRASSSRSRCAIRSPI